MLGLPTPYPNELLYSIIARAGVHEGVTSPKQLLDLVFKNRKVIATVDLPSHVETIATHYPSSQNLDARTLIRNHTLWPIYEPFQPYERNEKLLNWMSGPSYGAAHLASGIAASRVKTKPRLYVCPKCLEEQRAEYGEFFWSRLWQVPLLRCCPVHGSLHATNVELNGEHRHSYFPVEAAELLTPIEVIQADYVFVEQVMLLINMGLKKISFAQWTAFYKSLAEKSGLINGRRIDHRAIHDSIINFWGKSWLEGSGILLSARETSWLKAIFRKHRRSFSFAEHIVVVQAASKGTMSIADAIESASVMEDIKEAAVPEDSSTDVNPVELNEDQLQWFSLLEGRSPKQARKLNPAVYARLYRNHHDWLLQIDRKFHAENTKSKSRIDWPKRDRKIARELHRRYKNLSEDLYAPRLSKSFLIHQLESHATAEKNLYRLPRCSILLSLYTENTFEYQARRITRAYVSLLQAKKDIKRWLLLREAGLSDKRMTSIITKFIKEILSERESSKVQEAGR